MHSLQEPVSEQDVRVAFPEDPRLKIIYAEVEKIDLEEKKVVLSNEADVTYDDLDYWIRL